jgi:hypothetical protein
MGNWFTEFQRQKAWMTPYDEKREYKRYDLKAPVIYAYQDFDQFSKAQMYNYCEGGMWFEACDAIEPGSDIYIMMEDFSPDAIDAEFYDGYRAEVRWCRNIFLANNEESIVGVKYYKTIIK